MADTKLTGKKVLMVIPHTQFRDEEFFEPKKILESEGAAVTVASSAVRTCLVFANKLAHRTSPRNICGSTPSGPARERSRPKWRLHKFRRPRLPYLALARGWEQLQARGSAITN